jgi:hypothetical protein
LQLCFINEIFPVQIQLPLSVFTYNILFLSRTPTTDPCLGCNDNNILELGINKERGFKKKIKKLIRENKEKTFCIPHYICTFRRKRTALHTNQRGYIEDGEMLHQQTFLAWLIKSLAGNRLYTWDHNCASTFQRKKQKKGKGEKRKKKGQKEKRKKKGKKGEKEKRKGNRKRERNIGEDG